MSKSKNFVSGILTIIVAIALFIFSFGVPRGSAHGMGSDFFPKVCSALLIILGTIDLIAGIRKSKEDAAAFGASDEAKKVPVNLLLTIAALLIYICLMQPVGFIISTVAYIFMQILLLCPKSEWKIVRFFIISVVATFVIYVVFRNGFNLMLPAGILPV